MEYITLNDQGFADVSGWISCHVVNYDGEYIGQRDEYISATTGLPSGAYTDPPPKPKDGFVIVRGNKGWEIKEDHRGKAVFATKDGARKEVSEIGPIEDGYTLIPPPTEYEKWNGKDWVADLEAKKIADQYSAEQKKNSEYSIATAKIAPLQDAIDLDIATEEEVESLAAWKKYRVLINRVDTTNPDEIKWPNSPIK